MEAPEVVVIGGANMDVKARSADAVVPATSNPGTTRLVPGGVGRNIAENLARLGTATALVACVGDDALGGQVLATTADAGVDVSAVRRRGSTGTYVAVLDDRGELVVAVADMATTDTLDESAAEAVRGTIEQARLLVLDGNLAPATLARAASLAHAAGVRVVLEPVSVPKATRLVGLLRADAPPFLVTPNRDELEALGGLAALQRCGVDHVWVRHGVDGSVLHEAGTSTTIPLVPGEVVEVTGAGDAMLAGFCHALLAGSAPAAAAAYGQAVAALTVASDHTVRPDLCDDLVRSLLP